MVKYQSVWVGPLSRVTRSRIRSYEFEHNKIEDGLSNQRICFLEGDYKRVGPRDKIAFLDWLTCVCVCVRACVCVCT